MNRDRFRSIYVIGAIAGILALAITIGTLIYSLGRFNGLSERVDRIAGLTLGREKHSAELAKTAVEEELSKGGPGEDDDEPPPPPPPIGQVSFSFDEPREGQEYKIGEPLPNKGTYKNLTPDHYVWLVLRDNLGNYYLQNPPPRLTGDGSWDATVRPGENILEICAVLVDEHGEAEFRRKVRENEWGAFERLPRGSRIIGSRRIKVVQ